MVSDTSRRLPPSGERHALPSAGASGLSPRARRCRAIPREESVDTEFGADVTSHPLAAPDGGRAGAPHHSTVWKGGSFRML